MSKPSAFRSHKTQQGGQDSVSGWRGLCSSPSCARRRVGWFFLEGQDSSHFSGSLCLNPLARVAPAALELPLPAEMSRAVAVPTCPGGSEGSELTDRGPQTRCPCPQPGRWLPSRGQLLYVQSRPYFLSWLLGWVPAGPGASSPGLPRPLTLCSFQRTVWKVLLQVRDPRRGVSTCKNTAVLGTQHPALVSGVETQPSASKMFVLWQTRKWSGSQYFTAEGSSSSDSCGIGDGTNWKAPSGVLESKVHLSLNN